MYSDRDSLQMNVALIWILPDDFHLNFACVP